MDGRLLEKTDCAHNLLGRELLEGWEGQPYSKIGRSIKQGRGLEKVRWEAWTGYYPLKDVLSVFAISQEGHCDFPHFTV